MVNCWLLLLCVLPFIEGEKSIRPIRSCECGMVQRGLYKRSLGKKFSVQKIVGGQPTLVNEFPWTVGLSRDYRCRGLPVCGGALVSTQHVITAAHCVEDGGIRCVSLGDHDVSTSYETYSTKRTIMNAPLSWTMHEDYDRGNATALPRNDIAILILSEPIDFDVFPNIRPLCLPDPRKYLDVGPGTRSTVAGWGLVGATLGQSWILKKAVLNTVANDKCQDAYKSYPKGILETHICAYETGVDACQGDSGGALFAERPKELRRDDLARMELIGITSFGQSCGLENSPGGYTRANRYTFWILSKITDITEEVRVCNGFLGSWILGSGK